MNRSLANVLFAAVGTADSSGTSKSTEKKTVTEYSAEDAALVFEAAQSVIIVPGYGLAVAQAQHVLQELDRQKRFFQLLEQIQFFKWNRDDFLMRLYRVDTIKPFHTQFEYMESSWAGPS